MDASGHHHEVHPASPKLMLRHEFEASRRVVFRAWTDPKRLARWWGPHGFTNPVCELDARPGGAIRIEMRGPDGVVYPMTGVVRELVAPERLVLACTPLDEAGKAIFEVVNTAIFSERAGRTTLALDARVVASTPAAGKYLAGMEDGWRQSLDRLDELLRSRAAGAHGRHAAGHHGLSDTADREIVISRVLEAPREQVWAAWTDPKQVVRWWGPRGFTTEIERMDVRPEGVWEHVMRGPDGTEYPNRSVFAEVVEPERISFSHGGGRKNERNAEFDATWTFEALDPRRTKLTVHMVFPSTAARDHVVQEYGALEGGVQTLERLAEHLAGRP
jgi:uncharacterized protein YndB with AHSA1/START domain